MDDGLVSHGLCREHELSALISAGVCSIQELAEYSQLRSQYETITLKVAPQVNSLLRALCASVEAAGGRAADPDAIAGLALARQLNRIEYEKYPLNAYITGLPQ